MAEITWWNLNLFLAETISTNLRDMIANGKTVPLTYTKESWQAKLNSIATRLEAYKAHWDSGSDDWDRGLAVDQAAKQAMHELADVFLNLWD